MMEGCDAVEDAIESVAFDLECLLDVSPVKILVQQHNLKDIINMLEEKSDEEELDDEELELISAAVKKAVGCATELSTKHRQQHVSVSKVGKAIDKNFTQLDFGALFSGPIFKEEQDKKTLTKVIAEHLYRDGKDSVGNKLCQDSGIEPPKSKLDSKLSQSLTDLRNVLKALESRNLEPAFKWVRENLKTLKAQGSTLEFQLHCLAYLSLMKDGSSLQIEALMYARTHFPPFAMLHEKEIQVMMGGLLYFSPGGTESLAYAHLFDGSLWDQIQESFARDSCALLGVPVSSSLETICSAGCVALPSFLAASHAMLQARQGQAQSPEGNAGSTEGNELPVEIKLGKEFQFHSIFSCPILRQQTTASNPPMRLGCGHVFSQDALQRLQRGRRSVKCPYCSGAQNLDDAKEINF